MSKKQNDTELTLAIIKDYDREIAELEVHISELNEKIKLDEKDAYSKSKLIAANNYLKEYKETRARYQSKLDK